MEDLELYDNNSGVDQTSQGDADLTAGGTPSERQPQKVNLDDFDEFRKFKSEAQRREYQREQALLAERQQRQQMEARLRRIELDGLDEVGKIQYERDELRLQLQQRDAEENRRYQEYQWSSLVDEVQREYPNVPREELEAAKDSNDLWRIGRKYEKQNRNEDGTFRRVDDRVVLSGGKPTSAEARIREDYRKAKEDNDYIGMEAAKEKAWKAGIDPDSLRTRK